MRSLLLAVAIGLVGAAMLHIVIILSIPHFAGEKAWTKVRALGPPETFHVLGRATPDGAAPDIAPSQADPYLRSAICSFDAGAAPVRITDSDRAPFWSLAVYDPQSNEVYSMNDRTAVDRRVDITLATPLQLIALNRARPEALGRSILVELPGPKGYVVLRTIAADATWTRIVARFLSDAECKPVSP